MKTIALTFAILTGFSSLASAGIVGSFVAVTDEGGTFPPAGFVTQDLQVDASTDWTGTNLIVHLNSGSIYQDALSAANYAPPNPAFFAGNPTLRWDTYANGGGGLSDIPSSAGGTVDLGGSAVGNSIPLAST